MIIMRVTGNVGWACALSVDVPQLPCWSSLCLPLPHRFPHVSVHSGPSPRGFSDCHSPLFKLLLLHPDSSMWLTFLVSSFQYMAFIFPATAGVFSVKASKAWLFFIFFHQVSQVGLWHFLIFDSPHLFSCCCLAVRRQRLAEPLVISEDVGVLEGVGTKAL